MSRVHPLVWVFIATVILIGAGVWFFSKSNLGQTGQNSDESKPAPVSKPVEGTVDYPIVGRNHIAESTSGYGYNSDPPSSGPHWPSPAKNGVYDEALPDERLIHNLEHGYVWIAYKPDIADDVKEQLKKIATEDLWKVIMTPRDENDSKIALVAWGRVLKMDDPNYDKIKAFIKTYRNRGPEKTPD